MAPRYSIIPGDAVYDKNLTDFEFRVLGVIGRHSDNNGWCYLNQGKMAEKLGKARPSVNKAIKKLCANGYLHKEDNRSVKLGQKQQNICFYRIIMDRGEPPAELPSKIDEVHDPIDAEMGVPLSRLQEQGLSSYADNTLCSQDDKGLSSYADNTTTLSSTTLSSTEKEADASPPPERAMKDLVEEMKAPIKPRALPSDWLVTPLLYKQAKERFRLDDWQVDLAAESMRAWADENSHIAKGKKKDWNRAFMEWVKRDSDRLRRMSKPAAQVDPVEQERAQQVQVAKLAVGGNWTFAEKLGWRTPADIPAWIMERLGLSQKEAYAS